ncbi:hypothetical protein HAX54_020313, partial [Datura stramonium]|nr:hypothetical protein [Datura stramonium]
CLKCEARRGEARVKRFKALKREKMKKALASTEEAISEASVKRHFYIKGRFLAVRFQISRSKSNHPFKPSSSKFGLTNVFPAPMINSEKKKSVSLTDFAETNMLSWPVVVANYLLPLVVTTKD